MLESIAYALGPGAAVIVEDTEVCASFCYPECAAPRIIRAWGRTQQHRSQ